MSLPVFSQLSGYGKTISEVCVCSSLPEKLRQKLHHPSTTSKLIQVLNEPWCYSKLKRQEILVLLKTFKRFAHVIPETGFDAQRTLLRTFLDRHGSVASVPQLVSSVRAAHRLFTLSKRTGSDGTLYKRLATLALQRVIQELRKNNREIIEDIETLSSVVPYIDTPSLEQDQEMLWKCLESGLGRSLALNRTLRISTVTMLLEGFKKRLCQQKPVNENHVICGLPPGQIPLLCLLLNLLKKQLLAENAPRPLEALLLAGETLAYWIVNAPETRPHIHQILTGKPIESIWKRMQATPSCTLFTHLNTFRLLALCCLWRRGELAAIDVAYDMAMPPSLRYRIIVEGLSRGVNYLSPKQHCDLLSGIQEIGRQQSKILKAHVASSGVVDLNREEKGCVLVNPTVDAWAEMTLCQSLATRFRSYPLTPLECDALEAAVWDVLQYVHPRPGTLGAYQQLAAAFLPTLEKCRWRRELYIKRNNAQNTSSDYQQQIKDGISWLQRFLTLRLQPPKEYVISLFAEAQTPELLETCSRTVSSESYGAGSLRVLAHASAGQLATIGYLLAELRLPELADSFTIFPLLGAYHCLEADHAYMALKAFLLFASTTRPGNMSDIFLPAILEALHSVPPEVVADGTTLEAQNYTGILKEAAYMTRDVDEFLSVRTHPEERLFTVPFDLSPEPTRADVLAFDTCIKNSYTTSAVSDRSETTDRSVTNSVPSLETVLAFFQPRYYRLPQLIHSSDAERDQAKSLNERDSQFPSAVKAPIPFAERLLSVLTRVMGGCGAVQENVICGHWKVPLALRFPPCIKSARMRRLVAAANHRTDLVGEKVLWDIVQKGSSKNMGSDAQSAVHVTHDTLIFIFPLISSIHTLRTMVPLDVPSYSTIGKRWKITDHSEGPLTSASEAVVMAALRDAYPILTFREEDFIEAEEAGHVAQFLESLIDNVLQNSEKHLLSLK